MSNKEIIFKLLLGALTVVYILTVLYLLKNILSTDPVPEHPYTECLISHQYAVKTKTDLINIQELCQPLLKELNNEG